MSDRPRSMRRPILLLLLLLAAAAAWGQRPPAELKLVAGHWTAWDPPATTPADAEVYIVQSGDTLWSLAERFYGDPYLWPQLWERNQYVRDAHWIYPGDPLVIGLAATPVEELAALEPPPADQAGSGTPSSATAQVGRFSGSPEALGSEVDLYCSGFIGALDEEFPHSIIGSEYENLAPTLKSTSATGATRGIYGRVDTLKYGLTVGDILYLDGGSQAGMYPGDVYTALAPGEKAVHPATGRVLGRFYDYHGRVRVLSVQEETAIAEIVYSCDPINVGDRLEPFEAEPIPLGRRTPMRGTNDPVARGELAEAPTILRARRDLVSLGVDHVVFIDRDAEREQTPGDIYSIYRLSAPGLPPVLVGELAVLSVRGRSAIGRILESRHTVYIGDRLALKAP